MRCLNFWPHNTKIQRFSIRFLARKFKYFLSNFTLLKYILLACKFKYLIWQVYNKIEFLDKTWKLPQCAIFKDARDRHCFLVFFYHQRRCWLFIHLKDMIWIAVLDLESIFSLVLWKLRGPKFGFYCENSNNLLYECFVLARKFKLVIWQVFINSPNWTFAPVWSEIRMFE